MLRLLTFGGLTLVDGDAPVAGAAAQRSRLALLAVLAASGTSGMSREKLLACLWPESDTERARHALKQAVYALRRELGNEQAVAGTATLTLDPSVVASDVRDFDEAVARGDDAAAVALYAGPFLDGFHLKDGAEFERWADDERRRRAHAYGDALERLAAAAAAAANHAEAVRWWRRLAAADPLSGRVAVALMRAYADAGDLTSAVQHARVHEELVRQELDAPADAAVSDLAEQLRRGEWVPARASERVAAPAPAVVSASATQAAPPVERAPTQSAQRRRAFSPALAVLLIVVAFLFALPASRRSLAGIAARRDAPLSPRRIVVARFEDRTGDSSLAPVGELAADWISRTLLDAGFEVVDPRASTGRNTGAGTRIAGRYYRQGDTLELEATISDLSRGVVTRVVGPVRGPASQASPLVGALASRVAGALAASTDSTAGGATAALVEPPSIEAFEHTSRAWETFFLRPTDTAAVFAELARASALDSAYLAPVLMRAYVLDVHEEWPALARLVARLQPRAPRMSRVERGAMALYDADLRGDLLGRLRAARELARLNPGSPDMALLVAVSASYVNRFAEAATALEQSSPDRGVNLVSPMYWAWRALDEHALGRAQGERAAVDESARRFPSAPSTAYAMARFYAGTGRVDSLRALLRVHGFESATPSSAARSLALFTARELRAHGAARPADSLVARVASLPLDAGATHAERSEHALALYEAGRLDDARREFTALLTADSLDVDLLGRLGTIAARAGDSAMATRIDDRLARWRAQFDFGRALAWRARVAALRGDPSRAVALLHAAITRGYRPTDLGVVSLHEDADFTAIRADPGFRALVRPRDGPLELP